MTHQHLAGSPAFALMHGQLSMVLAGCQQLPLGWQQHEDFKSLLQRALDMLQEGSSSNLLAAADTAAHASDDSSTKRQPSADQDKHRQPQQLQKQQQQQHMHLTLDITAAEDYTSATAGIAAQVNVLGSPSSNTAEQLQALNYLAAAIEDEYAEVQEAETPARSAVCAAGGLNHLLRLVTAAANSSDTNIKATTGSSSSMEVAIAAAQLLLALTECRCGSHRYCNNWTHRYITPAAVPALARLLLFHDTIAKRAAELLTSLARDAGRCADIAAAGGIAGLLHVLSDDVLAGKPPASVPLAGNAAVLSRPYAVLAAAAAALEALIVDGPVDVQVAVAEAGGVPVLERICEHLVRQKMSRRQRLGAAKHQHHAISATCTVRAG